MGGDGGGLKGSEKCKLTMRRGLAGQVSFAGTRRGLFELEGGLLRRSWPWLRAMAGADRAGLQLTYQALISDDLLIDRIRDSVFRTIVDDKRELIAAMRSAFMLGKEEEARP